MTPVYSSHCLYRPVFGYGSTLHYTVTHTLGCHTKRWSRLSVCLSCVHYVLLQPYDGPTAIPAVQVPSALYFVPLLYQMVSGRTDPLGRWSFCFLVKHVQLIILRHGAII